MIRSLRWIAGVGLGVGVVSLAIAFALDRSGVDRMLSQIDLSLRDCRGGTGDATSERRLAWTGGDSIDIALPATVGYRAGEGADVVVRGSPDVIRHVELRGGRLVFNCLWHSGTRDIEVTLPGKTLRRLGISGSGQVDMDKISQRELTLTISGSGSVRAKGEVERLTVRVAGSGDAHLADLAARRLKVEISGSGNVEAAPQDDANVRIAGSGNVRLLTRPARLHTHIAGSGRISQPQEAAEGKK